MTVYGVVMLPTTSAVMQAEKVLTNKGVATKLIPTPREISNDCGIVLRFDWEQRESVEGALNSAGLAIAGLHKMMPV
jgi:hypothetical protein